MAGSVASISVKSQGKPDYYEESERNPSLQAYRIWRGYCKVQSQKQGRGNQDMASFHFQVPSIYIYFCWQGNCYYSCISKESTPKTSLCVCVCVCVCVGPFSLSNQTYSCTQPAGHSIHPFWRVLHRALRACHNLLPQGTLFFNCQTSYSGVKLQKKTVHP